MIARQDDIFRRLCNDSAMETWVEDKSPKWHVKCWNLYLNENIFTLAEKKHLTGSMSTLVKPKCSTSSPKSPISSRHSTPTNAACVICNKRWMKDKEPIYKVSTEISQQAIIDMAKKLNKDYILLKLTDQGHDMIANDILYQTRCMNALKASTGRSAQ